ncbi:hypothetical protein ES702_02617 [subsurface metagenome]
MSGFCVSCGKFSSDYLPEEDAILWVCPECMEKLTKKEVKCYFNKILLECI